MTESETPVNSEDARQKRRFKGCLIAFLISAAVIVGVPVTIGIVQHMRRKAEERFVDVLKGYCRAQSIFHGKDRDDDTKLEYSWDMRELVNIEKKGRKAPAEPPEGEAAEEPKPLVGREFAAARGDDGKPYMGYRFREMQTIWGIRINWTGDFALCATPAEYGKSGRRTYIVKTDGDVWWKDLGESRFLKNYPQNLEDEGWKKFGEEEKKDG